MSPLIRRLRRAWFLIVAAALVVFIAAFTILGLTNRLPKELGALWEWVEHHPTVFIGLLSAGGVGGSLTLLRKILRRAWGYEVVLDVVFVGAIASGKSTLSETLGSLGIPAVGTQQPDLDVVVRKLPRGLNTILGADKFTVYLRRLVVTPGAEPGKVVDAITRTFQSSGTRHAIVLTLSPTKEYERPSGGPPEVNRDYVREQLGYLAVPMAAVTARSNPVRVDAVVVFITKFDLYSADKPIHNARARKEFESLFADHVAAVKKHVTTKRLRVKVLAGSAKELWGVHELRDYLRRASHPGTAKAAIKDIDRTERKEQADQLAADPGRSFA